MRFYLLDLFRVFIVFVILLFHLQGHFGLDLNCKVINKFIENGAMVMTCFFMLSGFLLQILHRFDKIDSIESIKKFIIRRWMRIYPAYLVFFLILFCLFHYKKDVYWIMYIIQFIPLQAFFPQTFNVLSNGGLWFISTILFLYILFPFISFVVSNLKVNKLVQLIYIYIYIVQSISYYRCILSRNGDVYVFKFFYSVF